MEPWASCWSQNISSADTTMSANKSVAYRTAQSQQNYCSSLSTLSGTGFVYVEVTVTETGAGDVAVGVANIKQPVDGPSGAAGGTVNSIGWWDNGQVKIAGITIGTAPTFVSGNVLAIAVAGPLQTIAFRNVTTNTGWSPSISIASLGLPPYLLISSFWAIGENTYANFYGPFVGQIPSWIPAFTVWNPEALFSEQPVKVINFDAVLTDGSYTSSNLQDLEEIPFSYVKWGDAVLDAQANLLFTDWVIDDKPIFSIVIQADGPANNWLWAAWDYAAPFVFDKVHIPTTSSVAISNIEIPPPPPTANPQHPGQGHVLQIFSSCDNGQIFSWTQGRVFGTEDVLVWAPVEYATWPPSVIGQAQPVIGNSIQGGSWGPPIGPPLS